MTPLHEVITTNPTGGAYGPTARRYGQTFTDRAEAIAYARDMRRAGFTAEVSPEFATVDTATEALRIAARFYDWSPLGQTAADRENRARKAKEAKP